MSNSRDEQKLKKFLESILDKEELELLDKIKKEEKEGK